MNSRLIDAMKSFRVHPYHAETFARWAHEPLPARVCSCGHSEYAHRGSCLLNKTCGCVNFVSVASTADHRTFFQITHGPMEAHALGRGLALAEQLKIPVDLNLECKNWCSNYSRIGAFRSLPTRTKANRILTKNQLREIHLIVCDNCLEDLCVDLNSRN